MSESTNKGIISEALPLNNISQVFKTIILPRKKVLFGGLALLIVNRFAELVLPGSTKFIIDNVIPNGDIGLLLTISGLVTIALVVQSITSYFLAKVLSVDAHNLVKQLRVKMQSHIFNLPVSFFDAHKSGSLVQRIIKDVGGVQNLVGTGFVDLVGGLITIVISLIILLNINMVMTAITFVSLIIFGTLIVKAYAYFEHTFKKDDEINAEVSGRLTESLNGIRIIKGFNAVKRENKIYENSFSKMFNIMKDITLKGALVDASAILLMSITFVIVMVLGGNMIVNGVMTLGDFVAFSIYLGYLINPVFMLSATSAQVADAFAGLARMQEILDHKREDENVHRHHVLNTVDGNIVFKNVSFQFSEGNKILHNINFEAPTGSVTALVGSSGSGKSTLASLAASFLTPTDGVILVDDIDLSRVELNSYRSHLGVVLQDDFLYEGTIKENILFGNPDASESDLQQAAVLANVDAFSESFEHGLETLVGENGIKLSGGQKQRIAIARAILADPKLLILDEATSNLDSESEMFIQKSLAHLLQNRTTIVIAHRLSTIKRADQILVLEHGVIVERGSHKELMSKEGRYYDLHTYQSRI